MGRTGSSLLVLASIAATPLFWLRQRRVPSAFTILLDEADSVWQRDPPEATQDPNSRQADA